MGDIPSADTFVASGVVTAPGAGAAIASITIPGTGGSGMPNTARYYFRITSFQTGTIDTGHEAGLQIQHGSGPTVLGPILSTPIESVLEGWITLADGETFSVNAVAAFAASSVACATIALTRMG